MKKDHPPAFLFYVDDFTSDGKVEVMTTEEVGAYILLLAKAWKEHPVGSVPADDRVLAKWTRMTPDVWAAAKPNVMACFRLSARDGRYHQKRMQREWEKIVQARKIRTANARNAALSRYSQAKLNQQDTCDSHATRMPGACRTLENEDGDRKKASEAYEQLKKPEKNKFVLSREELLDEQWAEFRRIARDRSVLPGGETDWTWAYSSWRVLDFEQKQQAIEDLKVRPEDSPEMQSLPQNYLKGRKWQRPIGAARRTNTVQEMWRDA